MSEVKRYELEDIGPTYHKRTEMVLSVDGCWVDYDEYAELKAQRDALAAENASMMTLAIACEKEFGAYTVEEFPDDAKVSYPEERCNITFGMIRQALNKTATDAYLNSVRADAVVEASAYLADMAHGKSPSTSELIKACGRTVFAYGEKLRAGEPS